MRPEAGEAYDACGAPEVGRDVHASEADDGGEAPEAGRDADAPATPEVGGAPESGRVRMLSIAIHLDAECVGPPPADATWGGGRRPHRTAGRSDAQVRGGGAPGTDGECWCSRGRASRRRRTDLTLKPKSLKLRRNVNTNTNRKCQTGELHRLKC